MRFSLPVTLPIVCLVTEVILSPVECTVGICKHITLIILYRVIAGLIKPFFILFTLLNKHLLLLLFVLSSIILTVKYCIFFFLNVL